MSSTERPTSWIWARRNEIKEVTHDSAVAQRASRAIRMRDGRIVPDRQSDIVGA